MKVALCLYGFYNNRDDKNAGDKGYQYIQNKVYAECKKHNADLDVFFHCWEPDLESKLVKQYSPKKYECVNKMDFNEIVKSHDIDQSKIDEGFDRNSTIYRQCTLGASFGFFYSRFRANQLCNQYAEANNIKYDCVIVARFDLGQRSGWHKGYNVSLMNFDLNLDMNYLYSAMWKQLNAGIADQWFFSDQENITQLCTLYTRAYNYFNMKSSYRHALLTGWIDSNAGNQFSNEVLKSKEKRAKNLIKYPQWQMINNHIIHKWHLIKTGLYEKSRYIGDER